MTKRQLRSAVTCCAILAIVVCATAFVASKLRASLIDKSRLVPTAFTVEFSPYCWISHNEVIICRYGPTGADNKFTHVDSSDGTSTPLDVLNQEFRGDLARMEPGWISAPPDGKWLVFMSPIRSGGTNHLRNDYIAASLDGSHSLRWRAPEQFCHAAPIWKRDGHRCVETVCGNLPYVQYLVIHDVENVHKNTTVKLDSLAGDMVGTDSRGSGVFSFHAGSLYNGPTHG